MTRYKVNIKKFHFHIPEKNRENKDERIYTLLKLILEFSKTKINNFEVENYEGLTCLEIHVTKLVKTSTK